MNNLLLCLLNVILMSVGQLMFKISMKGKSIGSVHDMILAVVNPTVIAAICVYGFTTLLWLYILSRVPISYAQPIQTLAIPIVCIVAMFYLGETISASKWIGIGVIFIGVIIVSRY